MGQTESDNTPHPTPYPTLYSTPYSLLQNLLHTLFPTSHPTPHPTPYSTSYSTHYSLLHTLLHTLLPTPHPTPHPTRLINKRTQQFISSIQIDKHTIHPIYLKEVNKVCQRFRMTTAQPTFQLIKYMYIVCLDTRIYKTWKKVIFNPTVGLLYTYVIGL